MTEIAMPAMKEKHCKFIKKPRYPVHSDLTFISDSLLESLFQQEPSMSLVAKCIMYNIKHLFCTVVRN